MVHNCVACGKTVNLTKHHIIKKKYNGFDMPQERLCEGCHHQVHKTLSDAIKTIPTSSLKNEVCIGNTTFNLRLGSTCSNGEIQKIIGNSPVLGCQLYNKETKGEDNFEATLQAGSVVTFIGSPIGTVYYSLLYKRSE